MIYDVLNILKAETKKYLMDVDTANNITDIDDTSVVIENIANADATTEGKTQNKVCISLYNINEEQTLKNAPRHERVNGEMVYKSNPAYLNLYVMISANRTSYEKSLKNISSVVEFLQDKPVFTNTNTDVEITDVEEFKFRVDLYSLPPEQLSYAWGVLGGKVLPSALYKISVIKLQKQAIKAAAPLITGIQETAFNKTKNL
ncbi:MAG: DUF4255 domain-containing protein [Flavobacteriaceae bacterium]|nr:DUF4255 domain-containing protein [Flavobacteriaceae bacterium]